MKRGISLIILIITIIVMIILGGAIISSLTETDIINQAEEATFKTQVRNIQEALILKKASVLATGGNIDQYNIGLGDLGIEDDTYEKFNSKLFIDSKTAELYYQKANVTEEEERLLQQLGVKEGTGIVAGSDFVAYVTAISSTNVTEEGYPNYGATIKAVKQSYPNTAILAIERSVSDNLVYATGLEQLMLFIDLEVNAIKYLRENYNDSTVIDSTIEQEVREQLGGEANRGTIAAAGLFDASSQTVGQLIKKMKETMDYIDREDFSYVFINGEEMVEVAYGSTREYVPGPYYTIVNETEAAKFTYTEQKDGLSDRMIATITGFNDTSNSETIKIPSLIIKDDGTSVFVTKIATGALAINKPMALEAYSTIIEYATMFNLNQTYDETSLAETAAIASTVVSNPSIEGYSDDRAGKNQFLLDKFFPYLVSDVNTHYTVEGEGADMKIYCVASLDSTGMPTFYSKTTECVQAPDIIISEGIEEIEDNIITNRWVGNIYIPQTLNVASMNAFSTACVLTVKSPMTMEEICILDPGAKSGIFDSKCKKVDPV